MYRIKIDIDYAYSLASILKRYSQNISELRDSVSRLSGSLDWESRSRAGVDSMMSSVQSMGSNLSSSLSSLASFVENFANRISDVDRKSSESFKKIYTSFENNFIKKDAIQYKNPYYYEEPVPGRHLEVTGERNGQFNRDFRPQVPTDPHKGIDIWGEDGDFICSVNKGIVSKVVKSNTGFGNAVYVDTEIDGVKYQLIYAHLKEKPILSKGETINTGEIIGYMGHTGSAGGINHLHFEVRKDGIAIDPEENFFLLLQTKSTEWFRNNLQPDIEASKEANSSAQPK